MDNSQTTPCYRTLNSSSYNERCYQNTIELMPLRVELIKDSFEKIKPDANNFVYSFYEHRTSNIEQLI